MNQQKSSLAEFFCASGTLLTSTSNSVVVYLDESGDLGWTFDAPYGRGGSSRYLTITAVCVPSDLKHIPKRFIKTLYEKFNWDPKNEKKWSMMDADEREFFAKEIPVMCIRNPEIALHAIVVKKQNVQEHIREDANKLYNYMIRLSLLDRMAKHDLVTFVPDPRSIKVQSGNSLHDYLQMQLWFDKKSVTKLVTSPCDSAKCRGIQFSDMLAGVVQSRFENNSSANFQTISAHLSLSRLYF
jgi:hypothetical protein